MYRKAIQFMKNKNQCTAAKNKQKIGFLIKQENKKTTHILQTFFSLYGHQKVLIH